MDNDELTMDVSLAYCGLVCSSCPIHLATLETDKSCQAEMRVKIADELARIYHTTPKPEIITDCDGCKTSNGRLFTGCADCRIRNCAMMRNVDSCASCNDYSCDKLEKHFVYDPEARERLDKIRIRQNR